MHTVNISTFLLILSTAVSAELFFNVPVGLDHNAVKAAFIEHGIQGYDPATAPTVNGLVAANGNTRQLPHEARDQPAQLAAANAAPLQGPPPGKPVAVPLAPAHGPPNVPVQAVTKGNVVLSVSNTALPHAQPITAASLSSSVRAPQATGAVSAAPKVGQATPIAGAKSVQTLPGASVLTTSVGSDTEDVVEEEEVEEDEEASETKPAVTGQSVAAPVNPVKSATAAASTPAGSVASAAASASATVASGPSVPTVIAATPASAAIASTTPANAAVAASTTAATVAAPALTSIVAAPASTSVPVAAASAVTAVSAPVIAPVAASGVLVATAVTTQTVMAATASVSVPVVKSLTLAAASASVTGATTVEAAAASASDDADSDSPASAVAAATATADPSLEAVEPASASSSGGVKLKPLMFANRANMSAFKPDDLDKFTFPSAQPSVNLAGIGKGGDAHANSASDAMRMENSGRMGFQGSMPADEGHKSGAKSGAAKPTSAKARVAPTGAASGQADVSKNGANKSRSGSASEENAAVSQRSPVGLQLMAIVGAAAAAAAIGGGSALF